jgi:hypothetical protein
MLQQQQQSVILDFLVESPDLLRVSAVAMFIARWLFRDRK